MKFTQMYLCTYLRFHVCFVFDRTVLSMYSYAVECIVTYCDVQQVSVITVLSCNVLQRNPMQCMYLCAQLLYKI